MGFLPIVSRAVYRGRIPTHTSNGKRYRSITHFWVEHMFFINFAEEPLGLDEVCYIVCHIFIIIESGHEPTKWVYFRQCRLLLWKGNCSSVEPLLLLTLFRKKFVEKPSLFPLLWPRLATFLFQVSVPTSRKPHLHGNTSIIGLLSSYDILNMIFGPCDNCCNGFTKCLSKRC